MASYRLSFPCGGRLGRAGPNISMRAPETTRVVPNIGSHYRDSTHDITFFRSQGFSVRVVGPESAHMNAPEEEERVTRPHTPI